MSEADKPLSPNEQEANAIKAIAKSDDGALLHRYLRRILETVIELQVDSALREQNGRRSLARALMRLMAATLCGWEARVRAVPGLGLWPRDPGLPIHTAESVKNSADKLVTHIEVLLALQPGWMVRAVSLAPGRHGNGNHRWQRRYPQLDGGAIHP